MTVVEKVARAIYEGRFPAHSTRYGEKAWTDQPRDVRRVWLVCALAALKAMREPSEGMVAATDTIAVAFDDFSLGDGMIYLARRDARQAWHAMIDAAIAEHQL